MLNLLRNFAQMVPYLSLGEIWLVIKDFDVGNACATVYHRPSAAFCHCIQERRWNHEHAGIYWRVRGEQWDRGLK